MLKRRRRWVCVLIGVVIVFVMLEFCVDITTFLGGDGGVPPTETGTIPITHIPKTDAEFVEASIVALQELGW